MSWFNWFRNRRKGRQVPEGGASDPAGRVRAVQLALNMSGQPVRNSGVMDRQTRRAIQLFQRSVGLTETGRLDQPTVDQLKAKAGRGRGNPKPGRRGDENRPVGSGGKSLGNEKETH